MNVWPLKFREFEDEYLFTDDAGGFFVGAPEFLDRYVRNDLTAKDKEFLDSHGLAFETVDDLAFTAFAARWARRLHMPDGIRYIILVPTLRCDLNCEYCQVSRVHEKTKGFDWSEARLAEVIQWLDALTTRSVKIEFQGGEPLLRLDILAQVRAFCRERFVQSQFVVCTNLQNVSDDAWAFLSDGDTFVSTSFDGTLALHELHRTRTPLQTDTFHVNLKRAIRTLGPSSVSALPTIDPLAPPDAAEMIAAYTELGIRSIFLRRVNFQGFARKKYEFDTSTAAWRDYYQKFIFSMIEYNNNSSTSVEEYYLSHLLKRILRAGHNSHVDLRSPGWLAKDYIVIDYDGKFYPTDEARMVTRIGQVDLSVGSLADGIDAEKVAVLNAASINQLDPDCMHCVYQQYCGLNIVDDLSRYGRVDLPRHETDHCQNHLFLFDLAFELLFSTNEKVQKSVRNWLGLGSLPLSVTPRLT